MKTRERISRATALLYGTHLHKYKFRVVWVFACVTAVSQCYNAANRWVLQWMYFEWMNEWERVLWGVGVCSMYELLQESWAINSSPAIRTPHTPCFAYAYFYIYIRHYLTHYLSTFISVYLYSVCLFDCIQLCYLSLSLLWSRDFVFVNVTLSVCAFASNLFFDMLFLSVCLSFSLFALSVCLYVCFFCLSVCLFFCLSVCLFACLYVFLFVYFYICMFVCQPVYLSVFLSASLPNSLPRCLLA
jgi:hypothetical protein